MSNQAINHDLIEIFTTALEEARKNHATGSANATMILTRLNSLGGKANAINLALDLNMSILSLAQDVKDLESHGLI